MTIEGRGDAPPRRVAFVLGNLERGGAETQAVELARRLPDYGWEPVFLLAARRGDLLPTVEEELGFRVHDLKTRFHFSKSNPAFWWNLGGVIRRIGRLCDEENCVLIHSFLFWENVLSVLAKYRSSTARRVLTCRLDIADYKDRRPHYRFLDRLTAPMVDAVLCNSRMVYRDTLRREPLDRKKVVVNYNGVDVERFAGAKAIDLSEQFPSIPPEGPVVGCVGNLKPVKRHDLLIRATDLALKRLPNLSLVLAGRDMGEQKYLEGLAGELGIAHRVFFAGEVSDPAPWFKAFSMTALTSDHEGLPNTLLEAMAAGSPVVATRVGGVPEIVRHGKNGLLVERGDVDGLAEAISEIGGDTEMARGFSEAGRQRVRRLFTMRNLVEGHVELYESLLASGRPPKGWRGTPLLIGESLKSQRGSS